MESARALRLRAGKPTRTAEHGDLPEMVICAGLKSSGSTWLYNVVFEIMRATLRASSHIPGASSGRMLRFYADKVAEFPEVLSASRILVKTHIPDECLQILARFSHAPIFLTIREPRDAAASLMKRFGHRFERVLDEIARGSDSMVRFRRAHNPAVFRYEDRFFEGRETLARIATLLNGQVPPAALNKIFDRHTRTAVKSRISRMGREGAFGEIPDPDSFHPASHWHPGHLGTGTSGKHGEILSQAQQDAILRGTAAFCRVFGYPARPKGD